VSFIAQCPPLTAVCAGNIVQYPIDRDGKVRFGPVLWHFFENREPDYRSGSEIIVNLGPDCRFGPKWSGSGSQAIRTMNRTFIIYLIFFIFEKL